MKRHRFDVAIIGGGLSGLSAAAYLAKRGVAVSLFERNRQLGGFVGTFKRGGYLFEASTHQISADKSYCTSIRNLLGLKDLQLVQSPELYEAVRFDPQSLEIINRFLLPWGSERVRATLKRFFPSSEREIDRFMALITSAGKETGALRIAAREPMRSPKDALLACMLRDGKGIFKDLGKLRFPTIVNHGKRSYAEMLDFISDPVLRWVLNAYTVYVSSPDSEVNGVAMCSLIHKYISGGPRLVAGGTGKLIDGLVKSIEKNNGRIYTATGVRKILIEQGMVKGIVTENGEMIRTGAVIAAINTKDVFLKMIDQNVLEPSYIKSIQSVQESLSIFQVYLGLTLNPLEHGLRATTSFFDPTYDDRKRHALVINDDRQHTPFVITCYPDQLSSSRSTMSIAEYYPMGDWDTMPLKEYTKKKAAVQTAIINKVERVTGIPLSKHAEVIFSASPRTMKRYGATPSGAAIGARMCTSQSLRERTQPSTPIKNLFLAGSYVSYPGVSMCLESGIVTSRLLMNKLK